MGRGQSAEKLFTGGEHRQLFYLGGLLCEAYLHVKSFCKTLFPCRILDSSASGAANWPWPLLIVIWQPGQVGGTGGLRRRRQERRQPGGWSAAPSSLQCHCCSAGMGSLQPCACSGQLPLRRGTGPDGPRNSFHLDP